MRVTFLDGSRTAVPIAKALHTCTGNLDKSDSVGVVLGEKDKKLIQSFAIGKDHGSTLEHCFFTFQVTGISRGLLQEIARHRIASLSVKSTRYTLKRIKDDKRLQKGIHHLFDAENVEEAKEIVGSYFVAPRNLAKEVDEDLNVGEMFLGSMLINLEAMYRLAEAEVPNDTIKYFAPESLKTDLQWTINVRSLRNVFKLRVPKSALAEFRTLCSNLYEQIPEDMKFLFDDVI